MKLVDWLFNHAGQIHVALFKEPFPVSWTREKGGWLDLNEIFFRYIYQVIGDSWRDFRNAANVEIETIRKLKKRQADREYTEDYIGKKPEYWIVIFTVGFLQPINRYDVPARANDLGINSYAKLPPDIAQAVETLHEYRILSIEDDIARIEPKFSRLMEQLISAVEINIPKLRGEAEAWKKRFQK
jgi:hypothetical protein